MGRTDHVESETDQTMMLGERESGREEARLLRQDVLEVVDETLAIEKVVGRGKEVPIHQRQPASPGLKRESKLTNSTFDSIDPSPLSSLSSSSPSPSPFDSLLRSCPPPLRQPSRSNTPHRTVPTTR